jgi:hypothetical protein
MTLCPTCSSANYSDLSICSSCGGWIGQAMWSSARQRNPSPIYLDIDPNPRYLAVPQNGIDPIQSRIAELKEVLRRTQIYIDAAEHCLARKWFNRFNDCIASCQRALSPYVPARPTNP